jgi:hypothetical protein
VCGDKPGSVPTVIRSQCAGAEAIWTGALRQQARSRVRAERRLWSAGLRRRRKRLAPFRKIGQVIGAEENTSAEGLGYVMECPKELGASGFRVVTG